MKYLLLLPILFAACSIQSDGSSTKFPSALKGKEFTSGTVTFKFDDNGDLSFPGGIAISAGNSRDREPFAVAAVSTPKLTFKYLMPDTSQMVYSFTQGDVPVYIGASYSLGGGRSFGTNAAAKEVYVGTYKPYQITFTLSTDAFWATTNAKPVDFFLTNDMATSGFSAFIKPDSVVTNKL